MGRPSLGATPVMVRMPPGLLTELDRWISSQPVQISRPAAIRTLIALALTQPALSAAGRAGAAPHDDGDIVSKPREAQSRVPTLQQVGPGAGKTP